MDPLKMTPNELREYIKSRAQEMIVRKRALDIMEWALTAKNKLEDIAAGDLPHDVCAGVAKNVLAKFPGEK